ncbi:MAG TPA: hypothetical protein VFU47_07380, partial [Armatimonadota bacterium]|nr:hypothetical protein [Armatimonadota bacterium]
MHPLNHPTATPRSGPAAAPRELRSMPQHILQPGASQTPPMDRPKAAKSGHVLKIGPSCSGS